MACSHYNTRCQVKPGCFNLIKTSLCVAFLLETGGVSGFAIREGGYGNQLVALFNLHVIVE